MLFLQRTQVQFPAPTWCSQLPLTCYMGCNVDPVGTAHMRCTFIYAGKHTQKTKINLLKKLSLNVFFSFFCRNQVSTMTMLSQWSSCGVQAAERTKQLLDLAPFSAGNKQQQPDSLGDNFLSTQAIRLRCVPYGTHGFPAPLPALGVLALSCF